MKYTSDTTAINPLFQPVIDVRVAPPQILVALSQLLVVSLSAQMALCNQLIQRKPWSNPSLTQEVVVEAYIIIGFLLAVFVGGAGLILGVSNPN
jgi:hypothetical protein